MKKLMLLPLLALLCLQACKKDEPAEEQPEAAKPSDYFFPMKVGNYWVYESINSDGTNYRQDTLHIDGDSILNGRTYYHFQHQLVPYVISAKGWYADSSGYILSLEGGGPGVDITVEDTLSRLTPNGFDIIERVGNRDTAFTVTAGTFESIEVITDAYYLNEPVTGGGTNPRQAFAYHAKGVGTILNRYFFISQTTTTTTQLKSYNLEP